MFSRARSSAGQSIGFLNRGSQVRDLPGAPSALGVAARAHMKSIERHKLKENEFASTVARARQAMDTRGRDIMSVAIGLAVVVALALGYVGWRQSRAAKANALLASALAVSEAPVVAPAAPAPGSPMPVQQPGTFQTEREKLDAA